jgi:hypothetical protein
VIPIPTPYFHDRVEQRPRWIQTHPQSKAVQIKIRCGLHKFPMLNLHSPAQITYFLNLPFIAYHDLCWIVRWHGVNARNRPSKTPARQIYMCVRSQRGASSYIDFKKHECMKTTANDKQHLRHNKGLAGRTAVPSSYGNQSMIRSFSRH